MTHVFEIHLALAVARRPFADGIRPWRVLGSRPVLRGDRSGDEACRNGLGGCRLLSGPETGRRRHPRLEILQDLGIELVDRPEERIDECAPSGSPLRTGGRRLPDPEGFKFFAGIPDDSRGVLPDNFEELGVSRSARMERVSIATPGVGRGPNSRTSIPTLANPATSAGSTM